MRFRISHFVAFNFGVMMKLKSLVKHKEALAVQTLSVRVFVCHGWGGLKTHRGLVKALGAH